MKLSESVKPISYIKSHASEVIRDINENQKTLVITHNGKAKAILQDITVYEQAQEGIALLKILVLSGKEMKKGRYANLENSFRNLRKRIDNFKRHQHEIQS
ncbi:MAG: type II toxin-antitoxin system Phd/YefM family antitoxin [Ignavibacteriae bacterium]|nr:type II toxin-antitoxin system Phd/YefM family antitoxin [Ignavibacteriota bacterium]